MELEREACVLGPSVAKPERDEATRPCRLGWPLRGPFAGSAERFAGTRRLCPWEGLGTL